MPGLCLDIDTYLVDRMILTRSSWSDFRLLEKNQFMDDLDDLFLGIEDPRLIQKVDVLENMEDRNKSPFFCVFLNSEDEVSEEDCKNKGDIMARDLDKLSDLSRLCRGFWLLDDGITWDPLEHISYKRDNDIVTRHTRIFGRAYMRYQAERTVSESEINIVSQVISKLRLFDIARDALCVKVAESLFSQSFKASLQDDLYSGYRLLNLYSALATILDDKIHLILKLSDRYNFDAELIVKSRNDIAHGRHRIQASILEKDLRYVLRILLCEAIASSLEDPSLNHFNSVKLVDKCLNAAHSGLARIANASTVFRAFRVWGDERTVPFNNVGIWISEYKSGFKSATEHSFLPFGEHVELYKNMANELAKEQRAVIEKKIMIRLGDRDFGKRKQDCIDEG